MTRACATNNCQKRPVKRDLSKETCQKRPVKRDLFEWQRRPINIRIVVLFFVFALVTNWMTRACATQARMHAHKRAHAHLHADV